VKTLHVSLSVKSIPDSVLYYSGLFGRKPDVLKPEFAKWWLDDPKVNFALNAVNAGVGTAGLNHLGIEVDDEAELAPYYERAREVGAFAEEGDTECCYAQSTKGWASDPQGIAWEIFKTSEYLHDAAEQPAEACPTGCC
jgi:catechol 2,3-dioxygenase-like lactoylglutathione lyase family enzyme